MSINLKKNPLVWFEVLFVVLLAAAFLFGDRSQPRVTSLPTNLTINEPIIIGFDRPIEHTDLPGNVTLSLGTTPVAGSFTWSTDSLAFTPTYPLNYSTKYTLSVHGVKDIEGHAMRTTVTKVYATTFPRFLYISSDNRLMLYNIAGKNSQQLSENNEQVLGYSLSKDGTHVVIDTTNNQGSNTVSYLSLSSAGAVTNRTVVVESSTTTYPQAALCNNGSELLVYEHVTSNKEQLVAYPVAQSGLQSPVTLAGFNNVTEDQFACAESSDQVLYYNGHVVVTLASISDPSQQVAIGQASSIIGFSPDEKEVLVEETTTIPTFQEMVDAVGSTGLKNPISDTTVNAAEPTYNPTETELALAEDDDLADSNVQNWRYQIIVQTKYQGIVFKTVLTSPNENLTDLQPTWSSDGAYITFEQAATLLSGGDNRPTDGQGNYLDGTIMLVSFDLSTPFYRQFPTPVNLGITGGDITWLAG